MEFRIIKVEDISRYHRQFSYRFGKNITYYVVQYRKDPSFFGLIKHDWKSVRYNAEECAMSSDSEISLRSNYIYDGKDILLPSIVMARQLMAIAKEFFGIDPASSSFEIVYQEREIKETKDHNELAGEYDDLINK